MYIHVFNVGSYQNSILQINGLKFTLWFLSFIILVIINNPNPQLQQVLEPWFDGGNDIVVEIDGNTFDQQDYQMIQQLNDIVKENNLTGTFELGNLKITINNLKEYQNELIYIL